MANEPLTKEAAQTMSLEELSKLGRFNLRMLAIDLRVVSKRKSASIAAWAAMENLEQARYLYDLMHPNLLVEEMNKAASHEKWRETAIEVLKALRNLKRKSK